MAVGGDIKEEIERREESYRIRIRREGDPDPRWGDQRMRSKGIGVTHE